MNHYVIVGFIRKSIPQTFSSDWPLHVTIVRPFFSEKNAEEFSHTLKDICSKHTPIETEGKSREMFGDKGDVAVTELENVPELQALHDHIMDACGVWMEFRTQQYKEYRPHITDQMEGEISVGEKVTLDSVSLVDINSSERHVLATFNFKTSDKQK